MQHKLGGIVDKECHSHANLSIYFSNGVKRSTKTLWIHGRAGRLFEPNLLYIDVEIIVQVSGQIPRTIT